VNGSTDFRAESAENGSRTIQGRSSSGESRSPSITLPDRCAISTSSPRSFLALPAPPRSIHAPRITCATLRRTRRPYASTLDRADFSGCGDGSAIDDRSDDRGSLTNAVVMKRGPGVNDRGPVLVCAAGGAEKCTLALSGSAQGSFACVAQENRAVWVVQVSEWYTFGVRAAPSTR
jgi:hypothetical protein